MSNLKSDKYYHQKKYYRNNKALLNRGRTLRTYRNKYGEFMANDERINMFRQHKKHYLFLKELDKELLLHFLQFYYII